MAASGCDKKTLFSHHIEAAARYCFEVFGIPPKKSKLLKTTFFWIAVLLFDWNMDEMCFLTITMFLKEI